MAVRDLEAFIRQRAALFDPSLDLNPGSPFDVQVIQPIVRRLGTDPFSVDLSTFIQDRITQAYPELATSEGDGITDLLNKPATLLWDPIVREIRRIGRQQSFIDSTTLTEEEAEALGSNLFSERKTGDFARGVARIYFTQPQSIAVTPNNFVTSKAGLHYFPTETQSIRTEEMLLNIDEEGLYYFDINVIAEDEGTQYNIGPNELVSIASLQAAVRVRNQRRFRQGEEQETASQFIDRARQELTERSLVTLRGIGAKVTKAIPEVRRLNVVGFNDPEMNRDIIQGGGLGGIVAFGNSGSVVPDGIGGSFSKRFETFELAGNGFVDVLGSVGPAPDGYVLTLFDAFGPATDVRDLEVVTVVSNTEIEIENQILDLTTTGSSVRWSLRKRELTLSDIPGGIVFPDSPTGTVTIPDGEIHIGGMTDIHVRGSAFDEATLILDAVVDDEPLLSGDEYFSLVSLNSFELQGYTLDTNYTKGDATYLAFERANTEGLSLQVLTGPNAGVYRILSLTQVSGSFVTGTITPSQVLASSGPARWRIVDELNIDLTDPKETRVSGGDLETIQSSDIITTTSGIDFDAYGVAEDDILRIENGADEGDYTIIADPIAPGFTTLQVDRVLTSTGTGISFSIFRPNADGAIERPLVRITNVEMLDSSNQPQGTTIPYAKPVDIQSRAFQNPSRGVKHDLADVTLGLVSLQSDSSDNYAVTVGGTLIFSNLQSPPTTTTVVFTGGSMSRADVIAEIDATFGFSAAVDVGAASGGSNAGRFGIRPLNTDGKIAIIGGTSVAELFGSAQIYTSADIRSASVDIAGGWGALDPAIDFASGLDVFQVLDGNQIGFYNSPYTIDYTNALISAFATASDAVIIGGGSIASVAPFDNYTAFSPEANVRLQVGSRSIGSVRCYFLEPTSIEFDQDSRFSFNSSAGELRFLPDPTLGFQKLPPLPGGSTSTDGSSPQSNTPGVFTSTSSDFELSGVQPGDELVIEHFPLGGTIALTNPVSNLVGTTLIYSINNQPDRTLVFIQDDVSLAPDEVTQQGVIDQINASMGAEIASLTGGDTVEFETDFDLVIRSTGTANPIILGNIAGTLPAISFVLGNSSQRSNRAPHAGTYEITAVATDNVTVASLIVPVDYADYADPITRQSFRIERPGAQRISTTDMSDNEAEAGLYYFDVELVSEGTGDLWNIGADEQLTASNYRSDGYYLTTDNENLTFSLEEPVRMVISRTIFEQGVDDDPSNATQVTGQNLQITYERSGLVTDTQNFISSEIERVVNSNPLARHLIPHFVRFDLTYTGGSSEDLVVADLETLINDLFPNELLESYDIQKVVSDRGAESVLNPLDLIAIVHNVDRSITAQRSQNALGVGRLNTFIPDVLNISRNTPA